MEGLGPYIADKLAAAFERAAPFLVMLAIAAAIYMVWA